MKENGQGNIRKKSYQSNFTIVSNEIARSNKLSWDEKGMILFLMSHDESWKLYKSNIHSWSSNGKDSTRRIFDSLSEKGYIKSYQVLDSNNLFKGWEHVFDIDRFMDESSESDKPDVAPPDMVNNDTKNTNIQEYKLKEKKDISMSELSDLISFVNSLFDRKYNGSLEFKRHYKANIKEGWTNEDMKRAAINVKQDKWHSDKKYTMCSPEYIIRPSNMNRFVNMGNAGSQVSLFDDLSEPTKVEGVYLHKPSGKYWKEYSADKKKYVCQYNGNFEYNDDGTKIPFEA
jgi:hypothetical protein